MSTATVYRSTRKEYNDRTAATIVNPGFTLAEYESSRRASAWSILNRYDLIRLATVLAFLTRIVSRSV